MTGTRDGVPLCDEIVTPTGGLCDNSVWRDGKCTLHWGNSAMVRRPTRQKDPERRSPAHSPYRGGHQVDPPPEGMEAVWASCRRLDDMYNTLVRRQADDVRRPG